jgi:hypothetical protein
LTLGRRELTGEAGLSAGRSEVKVPVWGGKKMGRGPTSVSGLKRFPGGPFIYLFCFLLFVFCFLISLITFTNLVQIASNQLHKFCKIHSKVLDQHQTCFPNQNKIFNKGS